MRTMLATILGVVLMGAGVASAAVPASIYAVTPGVVNYQGRMTTAEGGTYTDGVYEIQFRIWDASSGGTALWGAKYTSYVKDGYFNVMLGAPGGDDLTGTTYGPDELWKALWYDPSAPVNELYLGVTVLNDANGDPIPEAEAEEAFPRQQLASAPFAARAQMAEYARRSAENFSVGSNLGVGGGVTVSNGLSVGGAASLAGGLTVSGGGATFGSGITVNGAVADVNKGLDVDGGATYLRQGVEVTGSAQLKGGAAITGDATVSGNAGVTGDMDVGLDVSAQTVTLTGFENATDKVIDFGRSYSVAAENEGSGNPASRLRVVTPTDGEIRIGPRDSTSMEEFMVTSEASTFVGPWFNLSNINYFNIEGSRPIRIRRYTWNNTQTVDYDTGYNTTDWSAGCIGYDAGYCDLDEDDDKRSWEIMTYKKNGHWWLFLHSHTHSWRHADWTVDVMFIRSEMVSDDR